MRESSIVANKLLFLGALTLALAVSACSTPQDKSIVKVQSGDQTLVDVKKDANQDIEIKIGMPKPSKGNDVPPDTTYDY